MSARVVKWIAIAIAKKNTISQIKQFSFLSVGRNGNTTQFDFLKGRNRESCQNYYIEEFFLKNWSIETGFAIFAISQIKQFDFESILQP